MSPRSAKLVVSPLGGHVSDLHVALSLAYLCLFLPLWTVHFRSEGFFDCRYPLPCSGLGWDGMGGSRVWGGTEEVNGDC